MKTLLSLLFSITLFFGLSLGVTSTASARPVANYPIISQTTKSIIDTVGANGAFVGSEMCKMWDGEYIVITFSNGATGVYKVGFRQVNGFVAIEPTLTPYGQTTVALHPTDGTGYYPAWGANGESYWGWTKEPISGDKIYFYCWADYSSTGVKRFNVDVTWGTGAGTDEPGQVIDRSHYGTVVGQPRYAGVKTGKFALVKNTNGTTKYTLEVTFDVYMKGFTFQTSTNLSTWTTTNGSVAVIDNSSSTYNGVETVRGLITFDPIAVPGLKRWFRLSTNL